MSTYFVVGASRGIGIALVTQILRNYEGSKVIAGARNPTGNAALQELKKKYAERLTLVTIDIGNTESVKAAADIVTKAYPEGIDYLINNGAVNDSSDKDSTPEELERVYNINVIGPLRVIQALLPSVKKSQKKVVINVSSLAGIFSFQNAVMNVGNQFGRYMFGYTTSKAALNLLTVDFALKHASDGIIFVPVHPGTVETDMLATVSTDTKSLGDIVGEAITTEESARLQLELFHRLKIEDSGKFFTYKGEVLQY